MGQLLWTAPVGQLPWDSFLPWCPGRLTPPQHSRSQGPPCTCAKSPVARLSAWWPQQHPTGGEDSVRAPDTPWPRATPGPGPVGHTQGVHLRPLHLLRIPTLGVPSSQSRFCATETPHRSPQCGLLLLCHRVLKAQCGIPCMDLPRSCQGHLLPRARPVSAEPSWSGLAHLAAVLHCAFSHNRCPLSFLSRSLPPSLPPSIFRMNCCVSPGFLLLVLT